MLLIAVWIAVRVSSMAVWSDVSGLMGAVVAFYFGARETHHFRARQSAARPEAHPAPPAPAAPEAAAPRRPTGGNPALEDWRRGATAG